MRPMSSICTVGCLVLSLLGCTSSKIEKGEEDLRKPINCATAEGDIRALRHEKAHVEDQIKAGVTSIVPAAALVNVVRGKEVKNIQIATGDYNKLIDARIAEIRQECGVK